MGDSMEALLNALYLDRIPASWQKLAWPSMRSLSMWLHDLVQRCNQLSEWTANPMEIPKVTWLSGLINPTSFLTAIKQSTAQKNQLALDTLVTNTEVTKRTVEEVEAPSRDGAYITGLAMQGARWDGQNNVVDKSKPKEMVCVMPVINVKGVAAVGKKPKGVFECPTYKTEQRGPTYVFDAQLKTKAPPGRWVLGGVALLMDVEL